MKRFRGKIVKNEDVCEALNRLLNKIGIAGAALTLASAALLIASPESAQALPSFARQTGQPCGACHTDFPQLTPFGRRFKLGGYTLGGGKENDEYKKTFGGNQWVPPISFMGVMGLTKSDATGPNVLGEGHFSAFYGGAVTEHLGVFAQMTYDSSETANLLHNTHWDNVDVRYADSTTIGNTNVTFGITAHNNPSVQDVWNTTPAWSFPFVASGIANTPQAATLIEGAFAQRAIGVGAYAFVNDIFYFEATGYKGISPNTLDHLGLDPTDQPGTIDRVAPYFRIAAEPHWGDHSLEVGAFGMFSDVNPQGLSPDLFTNPTLINAGVGFTPFQNGVDKYNDLGFDAQYQYITDAFRVTAKASYIHETQTLNATFATGLSANPTNTLNSFKANVSLGFGDNNRVVLTGGYFNTWGSSDSGLYGSPGAAATDHVGNAINQTGSPNTDGWIAEIAYIPFGSSHSPLWPWWNMRLGLQYVAYNKFNGSSTNYDGNGTNARDNNTLFAYLWIAM